MTKSWIALTFILLSSAPAFAADSNWSSSFKVVDADDSGTISRVEWESNSQKLKLDPVPTFTAMDKNVNNSITKDEWTEAEKMVKAFPVSCKSATSSWCEKQY
jgi:hypothetical protein